MPDRVAADLVRSHELEDLEAELTACRNKARRHWLWAVLGVSPSALLALPVILGTESVAFLVTLVVSVVALESYRAMRAANEANELETRLAHLLESG